MGKKVTVTKETNTGRNTKFKDSSGNNMTRIQFVKRIEQGNFPDYHVRNVNGIKTPCSNPNGNKKDNLG